MTTPSPINSSWECVNPPQSKESSSGSSSSWGEVRSALHQVASTHPQENISQHPPQPREQQHAPTCQHYQPQNQQTTIPSTPQDQQQPPQHLRHPIPIRSDPRLVQRMLSIPPAGQPNNSSSTTIPDRVPVRPRIEKLTDDQLQEAIFGTKRFKKNDGESITTPSFAQPLSSIVKVNNTSNNHGDISNRPKTNTTSHAMSHRSNNDDLDCEEISSMQGDPALRKYQPAGISSEIDDDPFLEQPLPQSNENQEKLIEQIESQKDEYLLCSDDEDDPIQVKASIHRRYNATSQIFASYKKYLIMTAGSATKKATSSAQNSQLNSDEQIESSQKIVAPQSTRKLYNDRMTFVIPGDKRYNLYVQFNTYMQYEQYRFLPIVNFRQKGMLQDLVFVSYNYTIQLLKILQQQETKERRTMFPCWVEAVIPTQHESLKRLAEYLLENNLVAGYNFGHFGTVNIFHVNQIFPELAPTGITLSEPSTNTQTFLIVLNSLEPLIYDSFSQKTLAYK